MDNIMLLNKLGMTEYEARAYLALGKLGPVTVREIVKESGLPRNKAYEALEKLEQKRFVVSQPVSPITYKIADPEMLKEGANELTSSVTKLVQIMQQPKLNEFKDLFWIIKGKKGIEEKLRRQNLLAKKEIMSCNSLAKALYPNIRTMKEAIENGVVAKMIIPFDHEKRYIYDAWIATGTEMRVFNKEKFGPLLPRITIFDGTVARLTIGQPEVLTEEEYITLWTESRAFSTMLRNHFMTMWRHSEPIEKYVKRLK